MPSSVAPDCARVAQMVPNASTSIALNAKLVVFMGYLFLLKF
jgi:hypothetical protein